MENNMEKYSKAIERLGDFGKLFVDYSGCPRGPMGRACIPLDEEVLQMPEITDVDGGRWIPVNADALHEFVELFHRCQDCLKMIGDRE